MTASSAATGPRRWAPPTASPIDETDSAQRTWLALLPPALDLGNGVVAFHARPGDDEAYLLEDVEGGRLVPAHPETVAARLAGVDAPVILTAHSHLPGLLQLPDGRLVLNPGSVGLPAYDDPAEPAHVSESGAPLARYAVLRSTAARVTGVEPDRARLRPRGCGAPGDVERPAGMGLRAPHRPHAGRAEPRRPPQRDTSVEALTGEDLKCRPPSRAPRFTS